MFSCSKEIVPELFQPRSDHEAYWHKLKMAELSNTALGKDWWAAAQSSLHHPITISPPYQEVFYLSAQDPKAQGFLFLARKGQKIQIDLIPEKSDSISLFVDLFRIDTQDNKKNFIHIASADKQDYTLGFEPRQDGNYILRIQPELLRGGSFNMTLRVVPSFRFPVQGKNKRAIGSFFGDERDGGRRKHHGIDIFAARHTPILAPTDGYIRFAGEKEGLGGKVVWMVDTLRDLTIYFAHLHTISVDIDSWVMTGDTLGTVGNTGNARTTAPHLHFGIYHHGPLDPYFYVADQTDKPRAISSDLSLVGEKVRTTRVTTLTELRPGRQFQNLEIDQYQLLSVEAAWSNRYRVRLPNGNSGAVHMNDVESINTPIIIDQLQDRKVLLESPARDVAVVETLENQEQLTILAKDTSYWYVRMPNGTDGWVEALP